MGRTTTIEKQDAKVTYNGTWTGLGGGYEVQLEDASDNTHGLASFGSGGRQIADQAGSTAQALEAGTDFLYDERLDDASGSGVDLYDDLNSGSLSGKMRVVHDAVNITNASGLNLKVRAKDMFNTEIPPPPADECYIDPEQGKVMLPRPAYFNKMSNVSAWPTPEIQTTTSGYGQEYLTTGNATYGPYTGKFGYCQRFTLNAFGVGYWEQYWYPFGQTWTPSDKGTISCWFSLYNPSSIRRPILRILLNNSVGTYFYFSHNGSSYSHQMNVNGSATAADTTNVGGATLSHLYAVWDKDAGLTGSRAMRVWLNGAEIFTAGTHSSFSPETFQIYFANGGGSTDGTTFYVDNVKIWDHLVSESPSWIYNSGTGRENALHDVYGSAAGYAPEITGTNNGLGYYYINPSTSPAVLSEANASGASAVIKNL